ncbi:MAG: DNA-3-methyladenine glycosylase I [Candidatus Marinimicrobia bacterium]|nr:DNA-3-methyladenine glycosylase I [Candidatus Neomarinimicrobiota bacterium]
MIEAPVRCGWPGDNELMVRYHDEEWGVPVTDDRKIFEFMILDAFQAGLSWSIVLNKRIGFAQAFDNFDPEKIALYDENKIQELILDPSIIRNKLKIRSTVRNAQLFLEIQSKYNGFHHYIWQFTDGKPIVNQFSVMSEIPAKTDESDLMSNDLKKIGFKFVGSTICYAFMQAAGMVNDHMVDCFRYEPLKQLALQMGSDKQ